MATTDPAQDTEETSCAQCGDDPDGKGVECHSCDSNSCNSNGCGFWCSDCGDWTCSDCGEDYNKNGDPVCTGCAEAEEE
jgi:hypothetical protein